MAFTAQASPRDTYPPRCEVCTASVAWKPVDNSLGWRTCVGLCRRGFVIDTPLPRRMLGPKDLLAMANEQNKLQAELVSSDGRIGSHVLCAI